MSSESLHKKIVLSRKIVGTPSHEDFRLEEAPVSEILSDQILVKVCYASVDPGVRSCLSGMATYAPAVQPGAVIPAATVGQVVSSRNSRFSEGDWVVGGLGWQNYAVSDGRGLRKLTLNEESPSKAIGVYGLPGMTAYFGLTDVTQIRPGETVLVSSAAGAVGSLAGQIARIYGAKVVGLTGSNEKVRYLTSELGFESAINYKNEADLKAAIQRECTDGVDVYFDNVGGPILDTVMTCMNVKGRVVVSGLTSEYNLDHSQVHGLKNILELIIRRLRVEGFVVLDYFKRFPEATDVLRKWTSSGQLVLKENWVNGLESAPQAFIDLFQGATLGRTLIQVQF